LTTWLALQGAHNARDLEGLAAVGRYIRPKRLLRSDSLQNITPADVRTLCDTFDVRRVIDLRSDVEVRATAPTPLEAGSQMHTFHLSLYPDAMKPNELATMSDPPLSLPWAIHGSERQESPTQVYLDLLTTRPENIVRTLTIIAEGVQGATLVHCAAGKDRTGVVIAVVLAALGVSDADIVDDFAESGRNLRRVVSALASHSLYKEDMRSSPLDRHRPDPRAMHAFLRILRHEFGGVEGWLAGNGWTSVDQAALVRALLD
jgi:protein-tyrosine phosphatase